MRYSHPCMLNRYCQDIPSHACLKDNFEQSSLSKLFLTVSHSNKLDPSFKNIDSYYLFYNKPLTMKGPLEISICSFYDLLGIKILYSWD